VAVPHELTAEQRLGLVRSFSQELANLHGFAVDFAMHAPRPHNDPRSYHAHLLTTTREVLPTGLGPKTSLDLSSSERLARGLGSWLEEVLTVRERWATLTNAALKQANVQARIDHRSLAAQGIDREPRPRIPIGAWRTEVAGQQSEIAERIRAAYRARVEQRLERAVERPAIAPNSSNLEEIRMQARQNWLRLRQSEIEKAAAGASGVVQEQARKDAAEEFNISRTGHDDDLAI
jgi:ATP-dependent exoDNAse (exonuclease V) alpha subunit